MTRRPSPIVRVMSVEMADGTAIDSPQARERIARALLPEIRDHIPAPSEAGRAAVQHALTILRHATPKPTQPAQQGVEQAQPA